MYRWFFLEDDVTAYQRNTVRWRYWADGCWFSLEPKRAREEAKDTLRTGFLADYLTMGPFGAELAVHGEAQRRLMQLAVAARRFLVERGRLPKSLDELVPDWIPALPLDPFGTGPLQMKRTKEGLVLYSVGPDGIDYDGAPLGPLKRTRNIIFHVRQKPLVSSGKK